MNILITTPNVSKVIATRQRTLEVLKAIADLYRDNASHIRFCSKFDGFYENDHNIVVTVTIEMSGSNLGERDTVTLRTSGGKEHYRVGEVAKLFGPAYSGHADGT